MRKYLEGSNLDQTNSRHPVEKIAKMLLTNSQKDFCRGKDQHSNRRERHKQPYTEQKISRDGMGWDGMGQDRNELELDRIHHIRAPAICSPLLGTPITKRFRREHHAQQSLLI